MRAESIECISVSTVFRLDFRTVL